jgi:hypothetical protein
MIYNITQAFLLGESVGEFFAKFLLIFDGSLFAN